MRRFLALAPLSALALVLAGAALAGNGGIAPVEPKSPNASGINESYLWVSIFTGAIFVLTVLLFRKGIWGTVAGLVASRGRRGARPGPPGEPGDPDQPRGPGEPGELERSAQAG